MLEALASLLENLGGLKTYSTYTAVLNMDEYYDVVLWRCSVRRHRSAMTANMRHSVGEEAPKQFHACDLTLTKSATASNVSMPKNTSDAN
ncbi:hypothetical protein AVEN_172348-1 [Araneus ventricosus]|uniref:Uncharacterized protein n=1 Tax=Araneus ventricosus TaxID=182803 RepID=A0A4Y2E3W3_ARAVE|nr:hypothetical protein AVEN_172348-1 [Araneus ventricosus]